jgi:hypothetical protein
MTAEQKILIEKRIDNEIVDTLCPLIKSAFKLIDEDIQSEFTYTYLLLFATAIERLQKIIYILKELESNDNIPDIKQFEHDTSKLYNCKIKALINTISDDENILISNALDIINSLVLVPKARYANFDFDEAKDSFEISSHIIRILDNAIDKDNTDAVKLSRNILSIILKKYIASLVDLIWNKRVNSDMEILPLCLKEFITAGYVELDLRLEIQNIINKENDEAERRANP